MNDSAPGTDDLSDDELGEDLTDDPSLPSVPEVPEVEGPCRVVLVEDEPLFRDLLAVTLGAAGGIEVIGGFDRGEDALEAIPALAPDVVLLDINLAGVMNGVQLGVQLRRAMPDLGVVLLSSLFDPTLLTSLPPDVVNGWSYLLKQSVADVEMLRRAIRGARSGLMVLDPELVAGSRRQRAGGLARLTERQVQLLAMLAGGYTNKGIAEALSLAPKSVENHLARIYQALDINTSDPEVHPRVRAVLTYVSGISG